MMKVKFCGVIALLFALLLMIGSCSNAGLGDDSGDTGNNSNSNGFDDEEEYDDEGDDNDNTKPLTARNFRLDAVAGLSTSSTDVNTDGVVGTLRVPEREGPWMVELVDDLHHNHLFAVNPVDSTDGEEGFDFWKVTIAEGPLEWGIYWISLRIFNADESTEYFKVMQFEVAITPAPFKKAPAVFPYIVSAGKNKLVVSWSAPSGSEGYRLYVGTDPATRPATPNKTLAGAGTTTAEITDIEDNETDGSLPDGTLYYVWVEAYNDAGGSFSPAGQRKTSETVQPYWYQNVLVHDCLYGDRYAFAQAEGTTKAVVYKRFGQNGADNVTYTGDILYHAKWNPEDGKHNNWPPDAGKHSIDCTGKDAGVFVIKYQSPYVPDSLDPEHKKLYSAVIYWGMDTRMPSNHPLYPTYGDSGNREMAFIVDQWAHYAERTSFEEAIDYFTCEKAANFIQMGPEPYAKFEVGEAAP